MKVLSIFSHGNEIAIRNNLLGQEIILYNGNELSRKFSVFGRTHAFDVHEEHEPVEYVIKLGYNAWGLSVNVWRNGEPLVKGLRATYEDCRPKRQRLISPTGPRPSYHHDLV